MRKGQSKTGENVGNQRFSQRHAYYLGSACYTQAHWRTRRHIDDLVIHCPDLGLPGYAADFNDQGGDALDMLDRSRVVNATLETMRGIGREIETARPALYRLRPPECCFQIDVGRLK